MNSAQKISKLAERFGKSVPIFERKKILGFIPVTQSHGWLWIEDSDDHWSVTLANSKTTHQPLGDSALGADFRKDDGKRKIGPLHLTGAWESQLSMWPIRDEKKAIRVFNLISSRIDLAFHFHCEVSA